MDIQIVTYLPRRTLYLLLQGMETHCMCGPIALGVVQNTYACKSNIHIKTTPMAYNMSTVDLSESLISI